MVVWRRRKLHATGTLEEPKDVMKGSGSNVKPSHQELGWTTTWGGTPMEANHLLPRQPGFSTSFTRDGANTLYREIFKDLYSKVCLLCLLCLLW